MNLADLVSTMPDHDPVVPFFADLEGVGTVRVTAVLERTAVYERFDDDKRLLALRRFTVVPDDLTWRLRRLGRARPFNIDPQVRRRRAFSDDREHVDRLSIEWRARPCPHTGPAGAEVGRSKSSGGSSDNAAQDQTIVRRLAQGGLK